MRLLHPLPSGRETDGYGPRERIPGVGDLGFHHGQDWAAPAGTPIRAMHDGWVRLNYFDPLGGWMVVINDGKGMESSYQHMRARSGLRVGQFVRAGTHIGGVGSTGASTGNHAHVEVWLGGYAYRGGTSVDPMKYLAPKPKPKPKPKPSLPTITPTEGTEYWEEPMKAIYYMNGKTYMVAVFHPVSGFWSEYNTGDHKYNNRIAKTMGTGNFTLVTKSHFNAMKRDLAALRNAK